MCWQVFACFWLPGIITTAFGVKGAGMEAARDQNWRAKEALLHGGLIETIPLAVEVCPDLTDARVRPSPRGSTISAVPTYTHNSLLHAGGGPAQ